jgi:uncharacterized protein Yka (UPF0111/DUF47 family)
MRDITKEEFLHELKILNVNMNGSAMELVHTYINQLENEIDGLKRNIRDNQTKERIVYVNENEEYNFGPGA